MQAGSGIPSAQGSCQDGRQQSSRTEVAHTVTDIERINQLIWSMGVKFRAEMARPAGPTPERFPVNQSFTLAATCQFWTLPQAVHTVLKRATPEEVARPGRRLGATISPLALWMFGYHFLVGREMLIALGACDEKAGAEDIITVLDCWRRLVAAHRADGHLDNSEAGATNLFLPAAIVQRLYRALIPVDAGITRQVQQFCSALEAYLFLLNAEARLGIADSGPYPLNADRVLIVRDFFDLKGARYPWRDVIAYMPYHTCTLAFTLDPGDFATVELSDRAGLLTNPPDYLTAIRDIALISNDDGTPRILPFTEMDRLIGGALRAHERLLRWFSRLSRREWIIAGAWPWLLRPLALVAEEECRSPWRPTPQALDLLSRYEDDDLQAVRWATHRCLVRSKPSAFAPLAV